jgi:hypothetical protein
LAGSIHTGDDEGVCIRDCHQGSWSSPQSLFTPQPRIPPFISKPKELEASLLVDMTVLLALIPQETVTAVHLVHRTITA